MKTYDIAFIGVGASALMASVFLDKSLRVAFIEKSSLIAPKLLISGGGKCNFTNRNISEKNYLGDEDFTKSILSRFDQKQLLGFLKSHNLEFELRKDGKYFCKRSSKDIHKIFTSYLKNFSLFLNHNVEDVKFENGFFIITSNHKTFRTKKLVISSGGLSFKNLGATDIGYKIAEKFGHKVTVLNPALVGMTLQREQFWMKDLSGISLDVSLHVKDKCFRDKILFAHRGISGPVVLNASLYWQKGEIEIDFLPGISIKKLLVPKTKKLLSSTLPLPKRFTKEFLKHVKIADKAVCDLSREEVENLSVIHSYKFSPAGNFGYTKAEVTKGGVVNDEVDSSIMMSKLKDNLYFLGEVLDVTGELGGYNLQWAFSTGCIFSKNV